MKKLILCVLIFVAFVSSILGLRATASKNVYFYTILASLIGAVFLSRSKRQIGASRQTSKQGGY